MSTAGTAPRCRRFFTAAGRRAPPPEPATGLLLGGQQLDLVAVERELPAVGGPLLLRHPFLRQRRRQAAIHLGLVLVVGRQIVDVVQFLVVAGAVQIVGVRRVLFLGARLRDLNAAVRAGGQLEEVELLAAFFHGSLAVSYTHLRAHETVLEL